MGGLVGMPMTRTSGDEKIENVQNVVVFASSEFTNKQLGKTEDASLL